MKIKQIKIQELKPYEFNTKIHTKDQVSVIANSIERFGFRQPIVIDKEGCAIVGHGRLKAAKKLGLKEVPCVIADDLTEDEVRAYRIADNKANESEWDFKALEKELGEISMDMSDFGMEFEAEEDDWEVEQEPSDERERTIHKYNMHLQTGFRYTDDFWQFPVIKKEDFIPSRLMAFNFVYTSEGKKTDTGVHFFVDDYKMERIWNTPERYIEMFQKYECILSPDYSLYLDMNMATKIWNTYRSRWVGAYFQQYGIKVIPTISWAEEETFKFCFKGIEKGSVVAISTIGVKKDENAMRIWKAGTAEMIKQIEPSKILVYGGDIDFDYGDIEVVSYVADGIERWMQAFQA